MSGTREKEAAQLPINQLEKNILLLSAKKDAQSSIDKVEQNSPSSNKVSLEDKVEDLEKYMRETEKNLQEQSAHPAARLKQSRYI